MSEAGPAPAAVSLRHRNSLSNKSVDLSHSRSRNGSKSSSFSVNLDGNGNGTLDPTTTTNARTERDGDTDSLLSSHNGDEAFELEMGRGNAYSSLPTSSRNGGSTSKRRSSGAGGSSARSSLLKPWQRNALIVGAVLLIGLFFMSSSSSSGSGSDKSRNDVTGDSAVPGQVVQKQDWQEQKIPEGHETASGKQQPATKAATAQQTGSAPKPVVDNGSCILPEGKSETEYALMIDAGSTGSRIHVYKFSNCLLETDGIKDSSTLRVKDTLPTLKDELFFATTPGLSSYKGKPKQAAESLRKLMEEAMKGVPASERSCTPIAVKATAGLRLLGASQSQEILEEVESWLKKEWSFHVVENGVTIMDGKDEGVYAWITINYLLGLVGPGKDAGASAAVMDLGGASTQIVFEPSFPSNSKLSPGDHVYDLNFASTDHTLYQHSHLGYGLMQARRSVHNLVAFTWVWQALTKAGKAKEWDDLTTADEIPNPCLVKGGKKVVTLDPPGRKSVQVTFVGTGAGFEACRRVVDVVMAKDALCDVEPCAFGGVYQPKLMETFGSGPIYALSYFYDRIVPLGLGKDSKPFTISDLRNLSNDVCAGPKPTGYLSSSKGWTRFEGNLEAMAELEDRPEYCLDLSFMYSLLSLGYELAEERELVTGKKINGVELGWALGAGIALLEHSSMQCRNPDN